MPIYISRGRFTSDAIKGMLAKPDAVRANPGNFRAYGACMAELAQRAAANLEKK